MTTQLQNRGDGVCDGAMSMSLQYWDRGWSVVPVLHGQKRPACHWQTFQRKRASEDQLRKWFDPGLGARYTDLAVVLGGVSGRLAVRDFDVGVAYAAWAEENCALALALPTVRTHRGYHVYFRLPLESSITGTLHLPDGEIRFEGGIVLLPPSKHPSGETYTWLVPLPDDDVPEIEPNDVGLAPACVDSFTPGRSSHDGAIIAEGDRNRALTSMAGVMRRRGMGEEAIRAGLLVENTERCQPPLDDREVNRIAASISRYSPQSYAFLNDEHCTDLGNARRLVQRHGRDLHYVPPWKKWLVWNGTRWCRDDDGEVARRAKETVSALYTVAGGVTDDGPRRKLVAWALKSEADNRLRAMVELARSEPGIPIEPSRVDSDPWLLNCSNGMLDLRTGELLKHDRDALQTKLVPVQYDYEARCPRWDAFLNRVMDGNQDLISFLQRAAGYSLTGHTGEHVMFIFYGTGRNGKSTYLETMAALLNDYAQQTPMDTLMVRQGNQIPNDLARLQSARLVTASESEEGQRLRESLIKRMTGGDRITARFLHGEFFEFVPAFKLFLAVNHRPVIRGTDTAIWERIRLIPFKLTIPRAGRDRDLASKLREELSGILRWAVDGCLNWKLGGLGETREVLGATDEYRNAMDILGGFLESECVLEVGARCRSRDLYSHYKSWCEMNCEKPVRGRDFNDRLEERGLTKGKSNVIIWSGIGLKTLVSEPPTGVPGS